MQLSNYWSATTFADFTSDAWRVNLSNGVVGTGGKADDSLVWCVRGGQGIDGL